jgi:hypothetical protein
MVFVSRQCDVSCSYWWRHGVDGSRQEHRPARACHGRRDRALATGVMSMCAEERVCVCVCVCNAAAVAAVPGCARRAQRRRDATHARLLARARRQ